MPNEKACSKCGVVKPLDEFCGDGSRKDGKNPRCRKCESERYRRWREENRDKKSEYDRRYQEGNRDKKAEHQRRYYEKNRDKERERGRRYYEENLEYVRASVRNYSRDYQRGSEAFRDKPKWSRWTPEEDAFLLANDGRTYYQKAVELGRTHASVRSRLRVLSQTQTT